MKYVLNIHKEFPQMPIYFLLIILCLSSESSNWSQYLLISSCTSNHFISSWTSSSFLLPTHSHSVTALGILPFFHSSETLFWPYYIYLVFSVTSTTMRSPLTLCAWLNYSWSIILKIITRSSRLEVDGSAPYSFKKWYNAKRPNTLARKRLINGMRTVRLCWNLLGTLINVGTSTSSWNHKTRHHKIRSYDLNILILSEIEKKVKRWKK